jgi:hypothetical protein
VLDNTLSLRGKIIKKKNLSLYSKMVRSMKRSKVIKTPLKKGALTKHGYSTKSPAKTRHTALRKAVKASTAGTVIKRLNVLQVYNKNRSPKVAKIARSDMAFVRKLE